MEAQTATQLGKYLGLFGVALGSTEMLFPNQLARAIGVERNEHAPAILRAFGAREIAASIAIFKQPEQRLGRWMRVVGDALDLGMLASAAFSRRTKKTRLAVAIGAVIGATVFDVLSALPEATSSRH